MVNNYYKNQYYPHITIGICKDIKKATFEDIIIKSGNLEIGLFYIGDYGTAIPIYSI